MGNRALVVFHDGTEYSPTTYLHWSGSSVPVLLEKWWTFMEGRRGDLSYSAARFVGICHEHLAGTNLSLGIFNTGTEFLGEDQEAEESYWNEQSHGDAGVFLVDCGSGDVRRIIGTESYSLDLAMAECMAPLTWKLGGPPTEETT